MNERVAEALRLLRGDAQAERVVPPSGFTAWLTVAASAAMAAVAVFALAFWVATGRLADRWATELSDTATVRIAAGAEDAGEAADAALAVLAGSPGVTSARLMPADEQAALLEPWFGPDLPLDALPVPRLIEITVDGAFDGGATAAALADNVPSATLDDHTLWRQPLVDAAARIRTLGGLSLLLILGATLAVVGLAARAALAANAEVLEVLRLVGAKDAFIARAFVRRFTLRAAAGALAGTVAAMLLLAVLPDADETFLTGLGFRGAGWLLPLLVPLVVAGAAFWATRTAALARLRGMP